MPGAVLAVVLSAALLHGLALWMAEPVGVAVASGTYLVGAAVLLAGLLRGYPHPEFGAANTITTIRLALACVLVAVLVGSAGSPAAAWGLPAVATVALALDGVDGWLARRTGLASDFGAHFDMEVDCLLALTLALLVLDSGKVGVWVIALGLPRYVFWAASWSLPWLSGPLPERRSRKAVCVAQILVLIALVSPLVGPGLAPLLAGAALVLVALSFAADVRYLHGARE